MSDRFNSEAAQLEVWREAMCHLRHLSNDPWQGLRIFLSLNGFAMVLMFGLAIRLPFGRSFSLMFVLFLSIIGVLLTLSARWILKRHRIYYLEMLAKKSLLEEEMGFYERRLAGSPTDLAFPWRLAPEVVAQIKQDTAAWIQKSIRSRGTIARVQFLIYETLIGIYGLVFLLSVYVLFG